MFKRRISAKFARLVVGLFVSVFLCATPAFAGNLSEVQAIYDRLIYDSQNIDDDDFFDDTQLQVIDTSQYVTGVVGNNADQAEHTVCPAYAYCSNECGADGHEDMYWLYHDDGQTVSDLQTELSSVMRAPSNVRDNTWKNTFAQVGRFLCPSNTVGRARSVSGNGYDPGEGCWCWWSKRTGATSGYAQLAPKVNDNVFDPIAYDAAYATRNGWYAPCEEPLGTFNIAFATSGDNYSSPEQWTWRAASPTSTTTDWLNTAILTGGVDTSCSPDAGANRNLYLADIMVGNNSLLKEQGAGNFCFGQSDVRALADSACEKLLTVFAPNGLPYVYSLEGISNGTMERLEMCVDPNCELGSVYDKAELDYSDDDGLEVQCGMAYSSTSDSTPHSECYYVGYHDGVQYKLYPYQLDYLIDIFTTMFDSSNSADWETVYNNYVNSNDITFVLGVTNNADATLSANCGAGGGGGGGTTTEYTCNAGNYLPANSTSCQTCAAGYYCPGGKWSKGTIAQGLETCPSGTTSTAGAASADACVSTSAITCTAGQYLPRGATACDTCPGGYFCTGGTFTKSTEYDQGQIACVPGSYSVAGASVCTACPGGKTSFTSGQYGVYKFPSDAQDYEGWTKEWKTQCESTCCNAANVATWNDTKWELGADKTTQILTNSCNIASCNAGYWKNTWGDGQKGCASQGQSAADTESAGLWEQGWIKTDMCVVNYANYDFSGMNECGVANNGYCDPIYTITLNDNGGTGGAGTVWQWYSNDSIVDSWHNGASATADAITTVAVPTKTGHAFAGYYTGTTQMVDATGKILTPTNAGNSSVGKNDTWTAKWTANAVACAAGKYLPKNSNTCATCPVGKYCPGGTYIPSTSDQGADACPPDYGTEKETEVSNVDPAATLVEYGFAPDVTGISTPDECTVDAAYSNAMGSWIERRKFDPVVDLLYNTMVGTYYFESMAGYYLSGVNTKCMSAFGAGPSDGVVYNSIKKCDAGYYCPAVASASENNATTCGGTNNPATLGRTQCATGYTSTAGATACTPITYKVTLDKQSGTGGTSEYYYQYNTKGTCYYYTSSALSACTDSSDGQNITKPTRTGYTFGGYWTGKNGTGTMYVDSTGLTKNNLYTAVAGNTTLYAKWTGISYTVKYDANGGIGTTASSSHTYGTAKNLTTNGFSNGAKKFLGWSKTKTATTATYSDGQSVKDLTTTDGDTITLYAIWGNCEPCAPGTGAKCELTVETGYCYYTTECLDGYIDIQNDGEYNPTCTANMITCEPGYYVPAGASECAICPNGNYCPGGEYLVLTEADNGLFPCEPGGACNDEGFKSFTKYNISYDLGTGATNNAQNPVQCGVAWLYNDSAWQLACSSVDKTECARPTDGPVSENPDYCTIAYDDGSQVWVGINAADRDGYSFRCWHNMDAPDNTCTDDSVRMDDNTFYLEKLANKSDDDPQSVYNIRLQAVWDVSEYNITYNLNGGTNPAGAKTSYTIETADYTLPTPTKTGYTFGGWYTNSGLTGNAVTQITKGSTGNKTFWAKWTLSSVTCAAGKYLPANSLSCTKCTAGYACPGGTFEYKNADQGITQCTGATYAAAGAARCTSCPSPYTYDTSAGKTKIEQCTVQTSEPDSDTGWYIKDAKGDKVFCPTGYYCPSAIVAYGSTNSPTACPAIASHTPTTWQSNYYSPTLVSGEFTDAGGGSLDRCAVTYILKNDRGTISTLKMYNPETGKYDYGWQDDYYMFYISLNPGYYFTNKWSVTLGDGTVHTFCSESADNPKLYVDAMPCPAGSYCPGYVDSLDMNGGTQPDSWPKCGDGEYTDTMGINACPTTYPNSAAKSSKIEQCYLTTTAGKYVATAKADQVQCLKNNYCAGGTKVHYGSTGGMQSCATGYESAAGASSCTTTTYTITYNLNSGTNAAGAKTSYTIETADYTLPTPTKTGYTFGGWYENSGLTGTAVTKIAKGSTGNKTFWAKWTVKSVTCAAGKYLPANSLSCGDCGAGYACPGGTFEYKNTDQGISQCSGYTKYSASGASSCSTVSAGYYTTGCNTNGNGCTGQSQCTGATYCSGGVQSDCPSGYTANTAAGKTAASQCTISVAAGKYLGTKNGTATTSCAANTYKAAHTVNYGSTSSCGTCPTDYPYSGVGSTSSDQCYKNGTNTGTRSDPTLPTGCVAQTTTACTPGTCTYRIYKSGTTTSCTPTNCVNTHKACTSAATDYYLDSGVAKGCSVLNSAYPKSDGGNITSSSCYGTFSKSGTQVNGTTPTNCSAVTAWNACTPGTCNYTKYASGTIKTDCTPDNCTKTVKTVTAKSGYYVNNNTSCSACSGLAGGFYPNSASDNTGGASVCYTNSISGKYVAAANATSATECAAGSYKGAHTVNYGDTSSCSACTGRTKYSAAGASACSTVSTGYYTTGCNTSSNKCTGQSQCDGSVYCTGGVQKNCPAAESKWTAGTGKGWSAVTSCFETKAATSVSTYCSAGQLKKNATNGTTWGASTISTALTAKPGAIVNGQTCTQCTGTSYSAGGTATLCTACPNGYNANESDGKTAASQCQIKCAAKTTVSTANGACTALTTGGYYKGQHLVNYGSTSSAEQCPAGYRDGAAGAAITDCAKSVAGGNYVKTANDANVTQCVAGTYRAAHTVNYGNTSSCATCATGYHSAAGATSCTANTYTIAYNAGGGTGATANTACTYGQNCTLTANGFTNGTKEFKGWATSAGATAAAYGNKASVKNLSDENGATVTLYAVWAECTACDATNANCTLTAPLGVCTYTTSCKTGYGNIQNNGKYNASCSGNSITCDAGEYLPAGATSCKKCEANNYCPGGTFTYTGASQGRNACPTDYPYSDAGSSSSGQCYKNGTSTGTRSDPTLPTGCVAQTTTACTPGTCTYRIYKSGTTTSCTPTNCVNTHKACTSAKSDYYLDSGVAKACNVLNSAYPKSDGGNITSSSCYGTFSKSGTQVNGATPTNCSAVTAWNACTPGTCNYTKYASGTVKTDCTPTDCTKTVKTVTAKSGYYVNNNTSCSACSGLADGFYPNSASDNTGGASVCYTNSISGKYVAAANATSATECAAGSYKGAHTVNYGDTSSCALCATGYESATGASSCSAIIYTITYELNGGAASTGNPATYTIETATITLAAPTKTGYTFGGWYADAAFKTPVPQIAHGSTGNKTLYAKWSGNTYTVTLNANGGTGGTASVTATYNEQMPTLASVATMADFALVGYFDATTGGTKYYNADGTGAHVWDKTSDATLYAQWLSDFISVKCDAGKYIATGASTCAATCVAGNYCPGGTFTIPRTGATIDTGINGCTGRTKYSAAGAASCSTVSAGYYTTGCAGNDKCTGQSQCTDATYCSGGIKYDCPTAYTANIDAGKTANTQCQIKCAAGNYVSTAQSDQTTCTAGAYCPGDVLVNWGGIGGRTLCTAGTYNPNTGSSLATACVKSDAGYYVDTNGATAQTACTGATYTDAAGATKCTTCPTATKYADALARYSYYNTGAIGDHTTKTKCQAIFNSTIDHGTLVNDACYLGSDNDYGTSTSNGASTCWLLKDGLSCDGGYYNKSQSASTRATVLSNACIAVGAGYWSATGGLTRTQCGSGLTTIGYGAGADEAGDCGRILSYGNKTVYLRSVRKTTPSLNVWMDGRTYYGNAAAGNVSGRIRVRRGDTTYSVYDDSMQ